MPRKVKQENNQQVQEVKTEIVKPDEIETEIVKPVIKPKRKCSEKQLAALAAGRAKNQRFKPK